MTERPAEPKTGSQDTPQVTAAEETPQFQYVEEFVRHQLGESLGGARGMFESALPFVAFTIAWVIGRELYPAIGAAVGTAAAGRDPARSAAIDQVRRPSGHPNGDRRSDCPRTGRAQDIFLPASSTTALAVISLASVAIRKPLVGFIIGAAVGDPAGWAKDPGLVE